MIGALCSTSMTFTKKISSGLGRRTWHTWPVIVPPVQEKDAFIGNALESVWQAAWVALSRAERVIVYGYSFPDADSRSRGFFLRAATSMDRQPSLVPINPDVAAASRGALMFSPSVHLIVPSVRDYLKHADKVCVGKTS